MTKKQNQKMSDRARTDFALGKPITAYGETPLGLQPQPWRRKKRRSVHMREVYEMAWYAAKDRVLQR